MAGVTRKAKGTYCVFNRTRESFLSLRITAADTHISRLRGLLGRLSLKEDEGIWVVPSQGVHTIGVLFPIDVIYLNAEHRVIYLQESFGAFRVGPVKGDCASVLEVKTRTIYSSQTQVGDELLICSPNEMKEFLKGEQTKPRAQAIAG